MTYCLIDEMLLFIYIHVIIIQSDCACSVMDITIKKNTFRSFTVNYAYLRFDIFKYFTIFFA
jgi:hypothetical protein